MGCLFFLSHLWHFASSYPNRPSTDIGGLAICFFFFFFSFHLFLVSKFLQCTFFHSPSFFHHSFVLVCLLHLGDPLNLYFRLVHFRLVCLGRTRGGLVLGFCNIAFSRQKASVLYIDLYIRTYIHMHIVNTEAFLVYLNYSITW